MANSDCFRRSTVVADLIAFEPTEQPKWRNKDTASTSRMIQEIIEYQKQWVNDFEQRFDEAKLRELQERMMMNFYEVNTDPLKDDSTEEMKRKQQEMQNIKEAVLLIGAAQTAEVNENESERDSRVSLVGLLEDSLLKEANKTIMRGVAKPNRTKPGQYSASDKKKSVTYDGQTYQYPQPDNMENAVVVLLDRYNSLIKAAIAETDEEVKFKSVFNIAAWLVVEFLHLHPFSDGNGRLSRILCNYVVSTLHIPFPTPIYQIYDQSSKDTPANLPCRDDYLRAMTSRMKSESTHTRDMAAMIIESNWRGWKDFMHEVRIELEG